MLRILRKSIHLVEPNRRWAWAFLAFLALLASAIEVVSALLVVVLLSTVSTTGTHIDIPVLGPLDERFPDATQGELIMGVCLVVAVFFLVRGVFTILQAYFQGRIAANAGVALASKLLRGYLAMDYTVHLKRNSAEMIRNVGQSVDIISQQLFVAFISLGSDLLIVFALGAVVVAAAPLPSLMAGATLGLITLVIIRGLNPRFAALGQTNQELTAATWQTIQHSLDGIRDLKVLGVGPFFSERYARQRAQLARVRYLLNTFGTVPRVALETVLVMFIVGLVGFFQLTNTSNEDALAVLGLFGFTAFRTLPAVTRIITQVNLIRYASAAVDHVIADLDVVGLGRVPLQRVAPTGRPVTFSHELAIDHVTYRYPDTEVDVIRDVNLVVQRGQSVGIVGSTGAGKSTLIDMVLGLLRPASGRVLVDGVDIATSTGQWQRLLGVVSQVVYLTDDSLEANIAFGVDPDDVDHARTRAAATVAQLDGLLDRLPSGLGTMVGERGVRLSGGERQRVAIARALYNEPEVLVFDEGTSALDNATEAQLIEAVERLRGSKTIITVAHRLTTVRKCDWIAVLERGEIVGLGTFDELVANSDAFRDLAALSGPL